MAGQFRGTFSTRCQHSGDPLLVRRWQNALLDEPRSRAQRFLLVPQQRVTGSPEKMAAIPHSIRFRHPVDRNNVDRFRSTP
jgi:hypothetical protein